MAIRYAPEGWIFTIPVVILTAAAILIQWYIAAIILGLLAVFLINFFRDPHRRGSERTVDVLSPADGTVVQIKDVADGSTWPGLTKNSGAWMPPMITEVPASVFASGIVVLTWV